MNYSKLCLKKIKSPCLIIETLLSNHYEIGADLALQLIDKKLEVYFCFFSEDIKLSDYRVGRFGIRKFFRMRKINKINNILKSKGVKFINDPKLDNNTLKKCKNFSNSFSNIDQIQSLKYEDANLGLYVLTTMISIHQRDNFTNNILNKIEFRKRLFTSSACLEKAKVLKKNSLFKTVIYLSGRSTTTYPLHFIFNKKDSLIREVCMLSNKASHRLSEESFFKPGSHAKFAEATCNGVSKSIKEKQASKYYSREYKHNKFVGKFRNEQVYGNLEEKLSEFKKNKKLLTFFSSSEDEFIAQHLTYLNKTSWNQMGALKELIKVVNMMTSKSS